jgi:UDP-N-acetylglucosamine--N-acetylmuramyl-(pentapeptide) pyrophosphoryl-undecaprenol N-acetylglucosamine transferase
LALVPPLTKEGFHIEYVGGEGGMEEALVKRAGISYTAIPCGKLRRYFSLKNVTDALRVVKGVRESFAVIKRIKPAIVFSKGGFVTVPVVIAASLSGVPVVIHESDMTPGLANKIAIPFADVVCASFPETMKHLTKKGVLTGSPVRAELFKGDRFAAPTAMAWGKSLAWSLCAGRRVRLKLIRRCAAR